MVIPFHVRLGLKNFHVFITDPSEPVPSDVNAFNINPILVEESIPITMRTHSIPSKHTTSTSDTNTSNSGSVQQKASR